MIGPRITTTHMMYVDTCWHYIIHRQSTFIICYIIKYDWSCKRTGTLSIMQANNLNVIYWKLSTFDKKSPNHNILLSARNVSEVTQSPSPAPSTAVTAGDGRGWRHVAAGRGREEPIQVPVRGTAHTGGHGRRGKAYLVKYLLCCMYSR